MTTPNNFDNASAQTADSQAAITKEKALELLREGNARFVKGKPLSRDLLGQVRKTAKGQYPFAAVLSCIDSRMPTEIIFDQGVGDIFNARIAGNFVNSDILGSLEFSCKLAGARVILVLGHTSCGAVKGACDNAELGNLTQMLRKITPAVDATATEAGEERNSGNISFVNRVATKNVELTMQDIRRQSPVLAELESDGDILIAGAMYDVATGKVEFWG